MYRLIYASQFKDFNDDDVKFEIHKNTEDNVTVSELIMSSDAITIDYESEDDLFKPMKCSGAKVSVLTKKLLTDLYSGLANEIYCKVYRKDKLFWYGFITPSIYNTDYVDEYNKLDLEFTDILSTLDNYKYKYTTDKIAITSFYSIINSILNRIDTDKVITNIYLQASKKLNNSTDLLNNMYVNERNFFDEDEEPETCKDVIEYISQYIGMTAIQFEDKLYFVDYESFKLNRQGNFLSYSRDNAVPTEITLDTNVININENVYEANASISLNDVYNKIVVIGSNNPIKNIIPDAIDDDVDIVNQNADPKKYYEHTEWINNDTNTLLTAFFKSKDNWDYQTPYYYDVSGYPETEWVTLNEVTLNNYAKIECGVYWQKVDSYVGAEPSSIKWKTYLTMVDKGGMWDFLSPHLKLKNKTLNIFKGGYFIASMNFKLSSHLLAHDVLKTSDEKYSNTKFGAGFKDTLIPCRLSIGNHYYDGERWVDYEEYRLKLGRDYYKIIFLYSTYEDIYWYRYYDIYGYQRFTTESAWNALPASVTKDKGNYTGPSNTRKLYYYTDEFNNKIFVPQSFYYECLLKDMFYLVHKNNEGDKVFDEEKALTNTVSYKMNLVDSEDGMAIKLPKELLMGELTFEIEAPNQLGTTPMWTTQGGCSPCYAFHFSSMSLKYFTEDYVVDIFNEKSYDADQKYENVIDNDIVNDLEDIEMRINTYNSHAGSYSYVITNKNNKYDYVGDISNTNSAKDVISENHIINKYHDYYCKPKFIYTNTIRDNGVTPITKFYENTLKKYFVPNSLSYNLSTDSVDITVNEQ